MIILMYCTAELMQQRNITINKILKNSIIENKETYFKITKN